RRMGFYIRKSVSVGPFRFNLSKSGVGVSTGIKGFRIGSGPRGNYVHMGRGGVYFRHTIPSDRTLRQPPLPREDSGSSVVFTEIDSGSVANMVDSTSSELLQEINSKYKKLSIWPWVLASFASFLILAAVAGSQPWVFYTFTPLGIGALIAA